MVASPISSPKIRQQSGDGQKAERIPQTTHHRSRPSNTKPPKPHHNRPHAAPLARTTLTGLTTRRGKANFRFSSPTRTPCCDWTRTGRRRPSDRVARGTSMWSGRHLDFHLPGQLQPVLHDPGIDRHGPPALLLAAAAVNTLAAKGWNLAWKIRVTESRSFGRTSWTGVCGLNGEDLSGQGGFGERSSGWQVDGRNYWRQCGCLARAGPVHPGQFQGADELCVGQSVRVGEGGRRPALGRGRLRQSLHAGPGR